MKKTVYIETTVISYLTAKPSRDIVVAGHQQITREWWDVALPKFHGYISPFVEDEISTVDADAARLRLQAARTLSVLAIRPEVWTLADIYFRGLGIPAKARRNLEARLGNDPEKIYRHYLNVQKKIRKSRLVNRVRKPIPSLSKAS